MIHGDLNDLIDLLRVRPNGHGTFRGAQVGGGRSRVYGGQFLGQGLNAALGDTAQTARSLQGLYIRAGSTEAPLEYGVAHTADDVVDVRASQAQRCLFLMDVRTGEPGGAPHVPMPNVPPPDQCIPRDEGIRDLDHNTDSTWAVLDSPFDYRFVENIWAEDFRSPGHHVWFRTRPTGGGPLALPQGLQQAVLAYFSDDNIMDNALFPHGWHAGWSNLQTASLDHSLWFHAPLDLNEWMLFAQDSPVASGSRGLARGIFYRQDGTIAASAYQEILMR